MLRSINKKAFYYALVIVICCIGLVFLGSRKLQNFDPALSIYLFGTLFALFGVVYRYSVWIQRPPTKKYLKRSLQLCFSSSSIHYLGKTIKDIFVNIIFQRFIAYRSGKRWISHVLISWGCMVAFLITFPLTFGWIHFTLAPNSIDEYVAHFFGFEVLHFQLQSVIAFVTFHVLSFCSIAIVIGCSYFLIRRISHSGLIATQTFEGDLLPLILLMIISITGLALNLDYEFMRGVTYEFMAIFHALSVMLFLVWIPFGKFFHIIQRPAQIGAHIYKLEGTKRGMAICKNTNKPYTTLLHVEDLKQLTQEVGFNFELNDGSSLLDYSPEGKRNLIAKAHLKARQETGKFFG